MKTQTILSSRVFLICKGLRLLAMILLCLFVVTVIEHGFVKVFGGLEPVPLSYYAHRYFGHYFRVMAAPGRNLFSFGYLLSLLVLAVLWYRSEGERRRFYGVWIFFAVIMSSSEMARFGSLWEPGSSIPEILSKIAGFLVLLFGVYCFAAGVSKRGSDEDSEEAKLLEPHH